MIYEDSCHDNVEPIFNLNNNWKKLASGYHQEIAKNLVKGGRVRFEFRTDLIISKNKEQGIFIDFFGG